MLGAALQISDHNAVWRSPRLRVLANGDLMPGAIEAEVISNNYYGADRFSVSLALDGDTSYGAAQFWASSVDILVEVQFSLDGGASFTSLVQGTVDSVSIDPVLGFVNLDGRDLAALLIEARTQESFTNQTSSEIAILLAGRHNLASQVFRTTDPVGRYYQNEHDRITLDQFSRSTTEWDLLVFLARQEGFDVFVEGQVLYFQPCPNETDIALTLRPTDVVGMRLGRALTLARSIQVIVKSWNSRQNMVFIQKAVASGSGELTGRQPQTYVFVKPNLAPDAALDFAQKRLAELVRHERTVEIEMLGELALTSRSVIALDGTGTDFDQVYRVDAIERRLTPDRGMTQFVRATNSSPRTITATATSLPQ